MVLLLVVDDVVVDDVVVGVVEDIGVGNNLELIVVPDVGTDRGSVA